MIELVIIASSSHERKRKDVLVKMRGSRRNLRRNGRVSILLFIIVFQRGDEERSVERMFHLEQRWAGLIDDVLDEWWEFLGKPNRVSAPTLRDIWPRLSSDIKMQIKGLHSVIRVLVHLVESWSRRCAVTRYDTRQSRHLYLRSSGAHLHSAPPSFAGASWPLSVVIAAMIHNDGPRETAKLSVIHPRSAMMKARMHPRAAHR